jgi:hypothetical protein
MKSLGRTLIAWLPLAAAIALLCGLIYASVQQSYRMGANDPQIQMAEDAARALAGGQSAESLLPAAKVNMAVSLSPYLIIYDANGAVLASNATLHGQTPTIPTGVLDYTRQNGEDRVTFQPEAGVRSAVVVAAVDGGKGGFVLAGRSLREAEARTDNLFKIVAVGGIVSLLVTFFLAWVLAALASRQK